MGSSLTVVPNDASRLGTYTGFHGSIPCGMPIGTGTTSPRVTSTPISAQAELPLPRDVIPAQVHQRLRLKTYDVSKRTVANLQLYFALGPNATENWYYGGTILRRVRLHCRRPLPVQGLRLPGSPTGRRVGSQPKMGLSELRPWAAALLGPSGRRSAAAHGGVMLRQLP